MKKIFALIATIAVYLFTGACANNFAGTINSASPFAITKIPLRYKPYSVEIADLNGDKIKDLVIANAEDSSVTILLGTGNGSLREEKGSPFYAGYMPNDIAIADFNKDGKPDLAFANHTKKYLTILAGDGKGWFAPLKGSPFAVNVRPHTHGIAVGDFNSDGNLDLVTDSWGNNQLAILFGNNQHGFSPQAKYINVGKHPYQRARVADLNKDGNLDIVTTNLDDNSTTILLGDGKGNFHEPEGSPFPCGDSPFGVAIGDVNGDGNLDLAIVNSPSITSDNRGKDGLTILLGDGKGKFNTMPGSPFTTGKSPSRVAIGDLNGDGIQDIVVTNYNSNSITIFLMNKNTVASSYTIPVGAKPDGIAISDLNGDGKGDVVVANSGDNYLTLMLSK
jgi:FG-GAP-like repeat